MRVAGLLSGTSLDGIDAAIADFDYDAIRLIAHATVPYPADVRAAILAVSNAAEISRLNFLLGELFAETLIALCERADVPRTSIELIGSHGQTIFHEGTPAEFCGRMVASTLQIGEAAVIAERTGIPVISDFRVADVAAGGQGAPLAPLLDYRLLHSKTVGRVALNIGGIANITVLPAGAAKEQVIAFDTGPGNMVMDALTPPFDRDGERARAGAVNQALLKQLLADPFYSAPPPKTAGREQYGAAFLECGIDIATSTELTARTIADAIGRFDGIAEVVVSGGGVHNRFLMERLRMLLPALAVKTSSEYGIDPDAKEALLFALLAYERHCGRAGNIPTATGARRGVLSGKWNG